MLNLCLLASPALAADRPFVKVVQIFGDLVDYDRTLIEMAAVPLDNGQPADTLCLVGAVLLNRNAPATPPRRDRSRALYAQFGGDWKPTPLVGKGPQGKDILSICAPFLRVGRFNDTLLTALETPGSFVVRDFTGSILQVYSPTQRIAVSIRIAQRPHGQ